ncbi:MAG: RecX family transcriptional regulator [Prevotellaceae bacterium]|jgi:regulatory protein|nr:RecX family transcriptional regulator [Prevotellaceae bacterium]
MIRTYNEDEAFSKLAESCSATEHCRADVAEKIVRWGLPYDTVKRLLNRLEEGRYIDEERYCRAFIHDKFYLAKWGKKKIAQALHLKKISPFTCNHLLNEIDEVEYLTALGQLLISKQKSVRAASDYERNGKLVRFALSRGYELKDIRKCMPDIDYEEVEEQETEEAQP